MANYTLKPDGTLLDANNEPIGQKIGDSFVFTDESRAGYKAQVGRFLGAQDPPIKIKTYVVNGGESGVPVAEPEAAHGNRKYGGHRYSDRASMSPCGRGGS